MFKKDYSYLLKKATESAATSLSQCSGTASTYSFGIVNSKRNGKRLTFSKALATALALEDTVELISIPDDGTLLVSKSLSSDIAVKCSLSGSPGESRICYRTDVVKAIVKDFDLNYDNCTSRSFNMIDIDKSGKAPVAIITIASPITKDTKTGETA